MGETREQAHELPNEKSGSLLGKGGYMRHELMATRMRYLQTAVKKLRNLISTNELATNRMLLSQIELVEEHLKKMEQIYVFGKTN